MESVVFLMMIIIIIIIKIIIIIIITLFQEDNIFGTDTSLTYGPPLTDVDMSNIWSSINRC